MMIVASYHIGMTIIIAKILEQVHKGEYLNPHPVSSGQFGFAILTLFILLLIKCYKFEKPNYLIFLVVRFLDGMVLLVCLHLFH